MSTPGEAPGLDADTLAFAHRVFDRARGGDAATLADLLDGGLPVDLTNDKGDTLLVLAAYHRHLETVRLLLAHGADTSRANDRGQTALAAAVFRQDADLVRALLDAGADPAAGSPSALETARFFDLPAMVGLLERG
jgi:ankyrin repeat protein